MIKNAVQKHLSPKITNRIGLAVQSILLFISIAVICAIIIDYGFFLNENELHAINRIYSLAWWIFFTVYPIRLLWSGVTRKSITMTLLLGLMLYSSAFVKFSGPAETGQPSWLWQLISGKYYLIMLLGIFSAMELSKGLVRFMNKKMNPALLAVVGFAAIIALGAVLLMLPRSTHDHIRLSVVDAIFTATSAVCVTGLSTVDLSRTFSIEGQSIIMLLIQTGGLGIMSITSFFAVFFMGGASLYNQFALRDMIGSGTFGSLISMLLYIFGFTIAIESIGALCIWLNIHDTVGMTVHEELFFSAFHSVSAFCNAGFSTLPDNLGNSMIITGHNMLYITISILIVLGGIGFPILVNIQKILSYYCKRALKKKTPRYVYLTNINTKIVLSSTIILITSGTAFIAFTEWDGAFAGMTAVDKIVHSAFNSIAPRTAGFNSVPLTGFSTLTIILYIAFMWIGGASQSTAGGIKVNSLAVSIANLISIVRGRKNITLFNREIPSESVRRASATIIGSILIIFCFFMLLVALNPGLPPKGLLFETVSAFGTVGSSLDITPHLNSCSKLLVSLLMFTGRVGLISFLMSILPQSGAPKYRYPKDSVIIN